MTLFALDNEGHRPRFERVARHVLRLAADPGPEHQSAFTRYAGPFNEKLVMIVFITAHHEPRLLSLLGRGVDFGGDAGAQRGLRA